MGATDAGPATHSPYQVVLKVGVPGEAHCNPYPANRRIQVDAVVSERARCRKLLDRQQLSSVDTGMDALDPASTVQANGVSRELPKESSKVQRIRQTVRELTPAAIVIIPTYQQSSKHVVRSGACHSRLTGASWIMYPRRKAYSVSSRRRAG